MFTQLLSIGFRSCLHCGSFAVRTSLLCEVCETNLFTRAHRPLQFQSETKQVPCLALFYWERDRNRILNRLSLALKGNGQQTAWRYYSERFVEQWLEYERPERNSVFVPCPAHGNRKDHAYLFAESLSKITGIPMVMALEKADVGQQKSLSRYQRVQQMGSRVQLRNNFNEKFSQVYFVDDIITTGATVLAANLQLKKLGRVKAISLIIRG